MKIAFLGTGEFAVPALRAVHAAGHEIRLAISQPDRPAGRGRAIAPTPVHLAADALRIPHLQSEQINALEPGASLRGAELAIVAAFGQKLGAGLLATPARGCINIHGSLLPRYRGAAPYQWALINGDAETGVTVFQIDERWDAGPIWGMRATPIGDTETADELHDRLATLGADLIVEVIASFAAGTAVAATQNPALATRAPKLAKADGFVDWSRDAFTVARRINGLWSWPSATVAFEAATGKHERVQLARAALVERTSQPNDAPAGAFRTDAAVQCGHGSIRVLEIKPAGGKLMPFDAFLRARDVRPPARFLAAEPA
jgi:methionyl-tRNA formyltransferase